MLQHYFNIARRSLLKHKTFSLINLFGLALGMACCMLIIVFISYELGFDKFHKKSAQIFRVLYTIHADGQVYELAVTPNIVSPLLQREFPEIEEGVRLYPRSAVLKNGDKIFDEGRFLYADSSFFDMFSFEAVQGDLHTALRDPKTLVLTESAAAKYFADENPLGKSLLMGQEQIPYTITGIIKDIPKNSHIVFDMVASFSSTKWAASGSETFGSANFYTYLQLQKGTQAKMVEDKIPDLIEKLAGPEARASASFMFQPLLDIHMKSSHLQADEAITGDITYIYLFGAIGLLILLIACINYMNLATARSIDRAKEIGLRKVIGAQWKQLFTQFMGEAALIATLACMLSLLLIALALPYFNEMIQRDMLLSDFFSFGYLSLLLGIALIVSILAGSYPAFVFANFQPIKVLRGAYKNSRSGVLLRKSLVVFQFSIAVILIAGTLVIQKQLNYIQNKKLGYEKDHLLVLPNGMSTDKVESFKAALTSHPQILKATTCTESPVQIMGGYSLTPGHADSGSNGKMVTAMAVDPDFVETMGLQIVAGQDYTRASAASEQTVFLLNETAVQAMGWQVAEAVGQKVNLNGRKGIIQGIINDFHMGPLHQKINPLVLFTSAFQRHKILLRIAPENIDETIAFLGAQWQEWIPNRPFQYNFVDEQFDQLYKTEERLGQLFMAFSMLAILIACLGLFGLASFTAVQRTKEIGIRKVLGASVSQLMLMLSRDFSLLVGLSFIVGAPLAWIGIQKWLEGFAYKASFSVDILLLSGLFVLFIAWLTTSWQAFRAANANPIEALRDE